MMKMAIAAILALGLLLLSACGTVPTIEAQVSIDDFTISQTGPEHEVETEKAPEAPAEDPVDPDTTMTGEGENTAPAEEIVLEDRETEPDYAEEYEHSSPAAAEPEEERQTTIPVAMEAANEEQPPAKENPEPGPTVTEAPEPVLEDNDSEIPAEPPAAEPEPEPDPAPAFDITYWVSFAEVYGQQAGLSYDAQATSCWDNPILASERSIYLERDITARLDRYVRYGYAAFCVWYEPLADGRYNIYIGYA